MSKIIKCKVDIAKDDYGMYKVEASGPCQEFEITRAKNTASMRNLAGNIDGATFDTWEESRVEDFSSKVIHQVILPMKMDVTAETGMYPQITVWDPRSRHFHSAIITREQQVEGKPTFNQIGIMGKCLETMINIPQRGEMHANTKSNTDTIQYVEIHELSQPGFDTGEKTPATDQFIYINDERRDNPNT